MIIWQGRHGSQGSINLRTRIDGGYLLQDATSQATDSAKSNLEAAKDSTAAAASDMKVAGKETLSQVQKKLLQGMRVAQQ